MSQPQSVKVVRVCLGAVLLVITALLELCVIVLGKWLSHNGPVFLRDGNELSDAVWIGFGILMFGIAGAGIAVMTVTFPEGK